MRITTKVTKEADLKMEEAQLVIQDYAAHQRRFDTVMLKYDIPYSDAGCLLGWALTDKVYTGDYTLEYALDLVQKNDSLFVETYHHYFKKDE